MQMALVLWARPAVRPSRTENSHCRMQIVTTMTQTWCIIKHSSKEKGRADTAFGEALSASWHYPGWIPPDRPKDLCVTTYSQNQPEVDEDNIQGVFFCPELLQLHLFVSVPA